MPVSGSTRPQSAAASTRAIPGSPEAAGNAQHVVPSAPDKVIGGPVVPGDPVDPAAAVGVGRDVDASDQADVPLRPVRVVTSEEQPAGKAIATAVARGRISRLRRVTAA